MSTKEFPYKTFGGWIRSFGIKVTDLTQDELEDCKEEYELRKSGATILDGLESYAYIIKARVQEAEFKKLKESQGK